jgi:hypothetical protein
VTKKGKTAAGFMIKEGSDPGVPTPKAFKEEGMLPVLPAVYTQF